jgi:GT2 family glycosyltransferase
MVSGALEAIVAADDPAIPAEVVLVVNTTDPETRSLVRDGAEGARTIVRDVNTGTAVGWNLGFAAARARHVALIHEDSRPQPRWLRALLGAVAAQPRAALVGSRLLRPDGGIRTDGAVAWADGSVARINPRTAPGVVTGLEPYPVSHANSGAMLVERGAWEAVGGFDERFFPAYRVDVDFGAAVWRHGRIVVNAPRSRVVHAQGASLRPDGGPYAGPLFRRFLNDRNRGLMAEKWAGEAALLPPGTRSTPSREDIRAALAVLRQRAAAPMSDAPPPIAARPLTGPGEAGLDERLEAAHAEVRESFLRWLVDTHEQLDKRMASQNRAIRQLRSRLAGG